jgi:hypothetical protein
MLPRLQLCSVPYALNVANGTIGRSKLVAGAVGTTTLADGAVIGTKIAASTILGGNIAIYTVSGGVNGNIAPSTVTGGNIAASTIVGGNIIAGAVDQSIAPFAPRMIEDGAWRNYAVMQSGTATTDGSGILTVTFPCGFVGIPTVVCTPGRGDGSGFIIVITNISSSNFTVKSGWPATAPMVGAATTFYWIAMGGI